MTDTSGYTKMRAGEYYKGPDWHLIAMQAEQMSMDIKSAFGGAT